MFDTASWGFGYFEQGVDDRPTSGDAGKLDCPGLPMGGHDG